MAMECLISDNLTTQGILVEWENEDDASTAYKRIVQSPSQFNLVIVDLQLLTSPALENGQEQKTRADEIVDLLERKHVHYVIYSNFPNGVDRPKRSTPYYLGSYQKGNDRQNDFVRAIYDFFFSRPFRILHFSDLHYNTNDDQGDRSRFYVSLKETLASINSEKKINLFVFSGDLTHEAPGLEIVLAGKIIEEIVDAIEIKKDNVFIVPGNHDVVWKDFENNQRLEKPYASFIAWYESFFNKNQIRSRTKKHIKGRIDPSTTEDGLAWHASLKEFNLSVIGLCSNACGDGKKGLGELSEGNIEFIKNKWRDKKEHNEIRILVLHHNVFPVRSNNSKDESRTITNAGAALNTLSIYDCDIVLNGHTHRPEIICYQASDMNVDGYSHQSSILFVTSGSSGGQAPTGDISKNFNIIDIAKNINNNTWKVTVSPYIYNSQNDAWLERGHTSFDLQKGSEKSSSDLPQ
jgi:3',5'-cyclic AMP phosphodiesterase CpdA